MAPSTASPSTAAPAAQKIVFFNEEHENKTNRKFKCMEEILKRAKYGVIERDDYSNVNCDQCGLGNNEEQIILCDKCDKGYHMLCVRPILVRIPTGNWFCPSCSDHPRSPLKRFSQVKIKDFFKIQKCSIGSSPGKRISHHQDARRHRKRSGSLVLQKKKRRLLPFIPSEDAERRQEQLGSLASALSSLNIKFTDDLRYSKLVPRSSNQANLEEGGMQVLPKADTKTLENCKAMYLRGERPPLRVALDELEGYTVEADDPIKDMTFITEYTGEVDYIKNREHDDCDSLMTLLLTTDPATSLVICPDKFGNIARFINGINNHTPEGRKKRNLKCVRYSVNGECRVFLVATRDIAKGERLYYDYNGYENAYPTDRFV